MTKEYIAAYKDGSEYVSFCGQIVRNETRGEIDYADAYEEFIDAQSNTHAKPVMLMREHGKAWRKMTTSEMRRCAG